MAPHRSEAGSSDSHFEDYWLFDRSSRTLKYVVGGGIGSALQIPSRRRSFSSNMLRKSSTSVVALDPEKPKWAQRKGIKVSRLTSMDSAQSGSIGHRMHTSARNKRSVLEDLIV
ncbi:MAG: hypothetical protein AUI45_04790 [Acidobacteria bacterium 13_1_40CM_2_56_11]|nr:MAG: hypothetical protein AUI45_04790 [Acidobacteria bacterium 13_1_40CM_2_56_11]